MGKSPYNNSSSAVTDTESDTDLQDAEDFEEYGPQKEAVIIFLDVDSFDVQVRGRNMQIPSDLLTSQPFVVVNEFNVITAVNYSAKQYGIRRSKECTLEVARRLCPTLRELIIPNHFGKPDALGLRKASDEIYESIEKSVSAICEVHPLPKLERASKDEYYIDVTDEVFYRVYGKLQRVPTHAQVAALKNTKCILEAPSYSATGEKLSYRTLKVLTNDSIIQDRHVTEALLMHGAVIADLILKTIRQDTGFILSGGVSSNKLLAKLGCGQNKPNALTVLPQSSLGRVSKKIKLEDIPGLGGSLGRKLIQRGIITMSQLSYFRRVDLMKMMGSEQALKFHQFSVGYDPSLVVAKKFCNSLTCGITFSYKTRRIGKPEPEHFHVHLKNRFLEMRDHLIYDCGRHGVQRIPKSLKLEIRTRKRSLRTPFTETVEVDDRLRRCIAIEAQKTKEKKKIGISLPPEWESLYERFLFLIQENCQLNVLDEIDYNAACAAIRKISEINLKAKYSADVVDDDYD